MDKTGLRLNDFKLIFKEIRKKFSENIKYLCQLDSVIGDGDHGTTISKAMDSAVTAIEKNNPGNISDLLKIAGNAIIDSAGGVTGIVFGSMFVEMGNAVSVDLENAGLSELEKIFEGALNSSMTVGKGTKPGEKTMVDALLPAVDNLKKAVESGKTLKEALKIMSDSAFKGAEDTKKMIAMKGRARYLGERSLGLQDPGATSIALIIESFKNAVFN